MYLGVGDGLFANALLADTLDSRLVSPAPQSLSNIRQCLG
jgi:hypothetical protein